jgi:hypothetical protein
MLTIFGRKENAELGMGLLAPIHMKEKEAEEVYVSLAFSLFCFLLCSVVGYNSQ